MADVRAQLKEELAELVTSGLVTWASESALGFPEKKAEGLKNLLALGLSQAKEAGGLVAEAGPLGRYSHLQFATRYQVWFTRSIRVVEQLLPDRYQEFMDLYSLPRRKSVDIYSYGIAEFISGVAPMRNFSEPMFDIRSVAMEKFKRQIDLVTSISARLESRLADIQTTLEADLFDSELDAARELRRARHLRGAGAVAGVVLESHLKRLIADHKVNFRKKPMLANLNQALKDAEVYDTAEWRRIGYLTDLRNECDHDTGQDPTDTRVGELIDGVERVIKTVF